MLFTVNDEWEARLVYWSVPGTNCGAVPMIVFAVDAVSIDTALNDNAQSRHKRGFFIISSVKISFLLVICVYLYS